MVILFNRPIWITDSGKKDKRTIIEIWGAVVNSPANDKDYFWTAVIQEYVEYLCGASKWAMEGHPITKNQFYFLKDKENKVSVDDQMYYYCIKARKQMGIKWAAYETSKNLDGKGMDKDGLFILSRKLHDNIQAYGAKVTIPLPHENDEYVDSNDISKGLW